MATITSFLTGKNSAPNQALGGAKQIVSNLLDFSATNVATSDVVQALKIPANALVTAVYAECRTAEGGVATINIGDASDVDGWDATVNVNSAAGIIKGDGAYAGGKRYTVEDTIDVIPTADLDTAVVCIVAEYTVLED